MELKRILARDLRAATEKAVSLYGTDALVVSHEQVNGQTEVIVAVDIEPSFKREDLELRDLTEDIDSDHSPGELQADKGVSENAGNELTETGAEFEAIFTQTLSPAPKSTKAKRAKASVNNTTAKNTGETTGESHREQLRAREIVDIVRQEMAVLRRELRLQQQLAALGPVGLSSLGQALNTALETL